MVVWSLTRLSLLGGNGRPLYDLDSLWVVRCGSLSGSRILRLVSHHLRIPIIILLFVRLLKYEPSLNQEAVGWSRFWSNGLYRLLSNSSPQAWKRRTLSQGHVSLPSHLHTLLLHSLLNVRIRSRHYVHPSNVSYDSLVSSHNFCTAGDSINFVIFQFSLNFFVIKLDLRMLWLHYTMQVRLEHHLFRRK